MSEEAESYAREDGELLLFYPGDNAELRRILLVDIPLKSLLAWPVIYLFGILQVAPEVGPFDKKLTVAYLGILLVLLPISYARWRHKASKILSRYQQTVLSLDTLGIHMNYLRPRSIRWQDITRVRVLFDSTYVMVILHGKKNEQIRAGDDYDLPTIVASIQDILDHRIPITYERRLIAGSWLPLAAACFLTCVILLVGIVLSDSVSIWITNLVAALPIILGAVITNYHRNSTEAEFRSLRHW